MISAERRRSAISVSARFTGKIRSTPCAPTMQGRLRQVPARPYGPSMGTDTVRMARSSRRMASAMVSQIRDKLTETQFRRLWMYYIDGMTVDEIGRIEGIRHQNISKSIGSAMKKIKKFFP